MKTEASLNEDILKLTMTIRSEFPELVKFLNEMPITIPVDNSPHITIKILSQYYDSLLELVRKYNGANHDAI